MSFTDVHLFREEAIRFEKEGSYCRFPKGTYQYREYWTEQHRRCMEGITIGNVHIPGTLYFYLNFYPIQLKDEKTGRKKKGFPRFTDVDFEYFTIIEQARKEKKGVILAKPRRTGFSFKNSALMVHEYNFYRDAKCIIGAYTKELSGYTMNMALEGLNFLDVNTEWGKKRNPDTQELVKARYQVTQEGKTVWKGYMSEIQRLTFKDNPFASVGKSASIFLFEEGGVFPNIIQSYNISEPCWKDGGDMIGTPIIYGTGGDMGAGTAEFAEMFYNPEKFNLLAFDNIWEPEKANKKCGWFIPASKQRFGPYPNSLNAHPEWKGIEMVDINGNSIEEIARTDIMEYREMKKNDTQAYRDAITQYPLIPSEAFLRSTGSIFPTRFAQERLAELETNQSLIDSNWVCDLYQEGNGTISFKLTESMPIRKFPIRNKDTVNIDGAIEVFEQPYQERPAHGVYIAGIDPYDDDESQTDSLGSVFVMNTLTKRLVAEYTGRPKTAKEFYEIVRRLLVYYNAVANYENNKKGLFSYFDQKNCLHLLCDTPRILKDQQITKLNYTSGNNAKGTQATEQVNKYARECIKTWMYEQAYGKEEGVTNTHTVLSIPLLQEIVAWNPDGNFDRVSALGMLLILLEDRIKIIIEKEQENIEEQEDFFSRHFRAGTEYNFGTFGNPY